MKLHMPIISLIVAVAIFPSLTSSQSNGTHAPAASPNASNFTYPQSLFVDSKNGHIWVADFDNHRVMRFDVSTLTSAHQFRRSHSPEQLSLAQNYPNPFNPVTQISFSSPVSTHASLIVYNLLGQSVAVLFHDVVHAKSVYSLSFHAEQLPSGIYLYAFKTEFGSEVKRMCLIK